MKIQWSFFFLWNGNRILSTVRLISNPKVLRSRTRRGYCKWSCVRSFWRSPLTNQSQYTVSADQSPLSHPVICRTAPCFVDVVYRRNTFYNFPLTAIRFVTNTEARVNIGLLVNLKKLHTGTFNYLREGYGEDGTVTWNSCQMALGDVWRYGRFVQRDT